MHLSGKSQSGKAMYYDSNYRTFWKRQKTMKRGKKISGCQGWDKGGDEQAEHRIFLGQ